MQETLPSVATIIGKQVAELLDQDNSGHDMSHIDRVLHLSLKFAEVENADRELVALVALLHDVDDYKLFGEENAENITNAKNIMNEAQIDTKLQSAVEQSLREIGYNKRLSGKVPTTLAGKIVSDADMCDGLGANGIIRVCAYGATYNRPFFDRKIFPELQNNAEKYHITAGSSSVCHIFEKVLKLKDLMLTDPGRKEATARHQFTIKFLEQFLAEENAEDWLEYLQKTHRANSTT